MTIVILRTKGTRFFSHAKGNGWQYWILNLIPRRFGIYLEIRGSARHSTIRTGVMVASNLTGGDQ